MENATLLYVMTPQTPDSAIAALAEDARARNARLRCLLLGSAPTYPSVAYGGLSYAPVQTADWASAIEETRAALTARTREIADLLESEEIAGTAEHLLAQVPDLATAVGVSAMTADMVSIAPSLREEAAQMFDRVAHGVIFASPAPLFLGQNPLRPVERVFVGWNGSLPAARAIRLALPFLIEAEEVTLAIFDPGPNDGETPGADMAAWLSRHGCAVSVQHYPTGGDLVGDALRKRATETGADLVVMGAYGRSRMRELVFGGSTRTMLAQTRVPVLMAH